MTLFFFIFLKFFYDDTNWQSLKLILLMIMQMINSIIIFYPFYHLKKCKYYENEKRKKTY